VPQIPRQEFHKPIGPVMELTKATQA